MSPENPQNRSRSSPASSSSGASVEYTDAVARTLPLVAAPHNTQPAPRPSVELRRHKTAAEELSFKLFDGQSLQYSDKIIDGVYDIWGKFVGTADNTPVALFPSLNELSRVNVSHLDVREVVVVDQTKDERLRELVERACHVLESSKAAGALVCVQRLAVLVSEAMGGASNHEELHTRYSNLVHQFKMQRNSLVLYLGELTVGLSRHRSFLCKVLADRWGLPCRLLRGDFYLGSAGHSGQNSLVMLEFNGQEWMVELVTEPGRLYHVRKGTVPQISREQMWNNHRAWQSAEPNPPQAFHGFPTVPNDPTLHRAERSSSSGTTASSGQRDGLQWSDLDGPAMDELSESQTKATPSSVNADEQHKSAQSGFSAGFRTSASQRKAQADEQLQGLSKRLSIQRALSTGNESIACLSDADADGGDSLERQASAPTAATQKGRGSSGSEGWIPFKDPSMIPYHQLGPLEEVHMIKPGKFGSTPGGGKSRARVRGRDDKGRLVELDLEGLTVTHAHNLETGNRSLDTIRPGLPRRSEDIQRPSRSLESMISRYRILDANDVDRPLWSGEKHSGSQGRSQQAEELGWNLQNLMLSKSGSIPRSSKGHQSAREGNSAVRSFLASKLPALSEGEISKGQAWEQQMRERHSSDSYGRASDDSKGGQQSMGRKTSQDSDSARRDSNQSVPPEVAEKMVLGLLHNADIASQLSSPAGKVQREEVHVETSGAPGKEADTGRGSPPWSKESKAQAVSSQPTFSAFDSSASAGSSLEAGTGSSSAASVADRMTLASKQNLANMRAQEESRGRNPRVKEHRSSNSTFYDMMGMASSAREVDAKRHQYFSRTSDEDKRDSDSTPPNLSRSSAEDREPQYMIPPEADEAEVDFSEIELGPRIGIGCFGEVFKARWRQTTVAVKRLFDQSIAEQTLREFKAEVLLNRRLKHPNVVMFMGACTKPPNLSMITQWAPKGSLFHLLHSPQPGRPPLTLRQKLRMALDIARGMHYLHSAKPPVIHRDLKSMNLLVDNDLTIKVCDFGLARIRSSTWMTGRSQGGTPEWTAPEVLRNAQYNEKSDVYSYGVVLYEIATEKEPWDEMTPMQVVGAVGWADNRLEPPEDCPPIFADLMLRCFKGPDERPSFETIIQELLRHANEARPTS